MNRKEYLSDTRYAKVLEQMDLLQIMDITTTRQSKNGYTLDLENKLKNPEVKVIVNGQRYNVI